MSEIVAAVSFERRGHYEDERGNGIAVKVSKAQAAKANGIACDRGQREGKEVHRYTIADDLEVLSELVDADFCIMSPIAYFGKKRCGKKARYLYALVFDLDGVGMPQLCDTLHQMDEGILPKAAERACTSTMF